MGNTYSYVTSFFTSDNVVATKPIDAAEHDEREKRLLSFIQKQKSVTVILYGRFNAGKKTALKQIDKIFKKSGVVKHLVPCTSGNGAVPVQFEREDLGGRTFSRTLYLRPAATVLMIDSEKKSRGKQWEMDDLRYQVQFLYEMWHLQGRTVRSLRAAPAHLGQQEGSA